MKLAARRQMAHAAESLRLTAGQFGAGLLPPPWFD
jgi:hypothetical protein